MSGTRRAAPPCFGKQFNATAAECMGGLDPDYTHPKTRTHRRDPCVFRFECMKEKTKEFVVVKKGKPEKMNTLRHTEMCLWQDVVVAILSCDRYCTVKGAVEAADEVLVARRERFHDTLKELDSDGVLASTFPSPKQCVKCQSVIEEPQLPDQDELCSECSGPE